MMEFRWIFCHFHLSGKDTKFLVYGSFHKFWFSCLRGVTTETWSEKDPIFIPHYSFNFY